MRVKHLEKYFLILALLSLIFSLFIFSSTGHKIEQIAYQSEFFVSKKKSGKSYFVFGKEIAIMPGDYLYLYDKDNGSEDSYLIDHVLVPSREPVEIFTENEVIKGTSRQEMVFEKNWRALPGVFSVRLASKETKQVKLAEVKAIKGNLWLSIDASLRTLNNEEFSLSFYQKTIDNSVEGYLPERLKWINPTTDSNQTAYDLFTPPIIYMHNGELSTRLPEKEEEEQKLEPFGLSMVGVTKAQYPLRLKSWVGETPYFEDIEYSEEGSPKIVRNRIEVGKPYKRTIEHKPGQPSLVQCDANDTEKLFTVQYFAVQQYRNPETGGLKPVGRAMILDHKLGGRPFEINTLMKEVYAGNWTFKFLASLPGLSPKEFSFESSQSLATFEYGGRKYLVTEVDLENKFVKVTKQDPRMVEDSHQSFSF